MQDVIYMVVLIGLFGLGVAFVRGCDRIIGPDQDALAEGLRGSIDDPRLAATDTEAQPGQADVAEVAR